jgi:TctA family transporter
MEVLSGVLLGLQVALQPENLLFCLVGVLLGTMIGVLPGIGPVATVAILLPVTYALTPVAALIMLAGIFYGSQYGGSTTAILINVPGEAASVVTALDGYTMARQGRAGPALAIAAISSFVAGTAATVVIILFAPVLARFGLAFGPAEYVALMVLGLVAAVVLSGADIARSLVMALAGVFLGLVGIDVNTGTPRYTFGIAALNDGLGFVPIAVGLFGIAEVLRNLEKPEVREALSRKVEGLMLSRADLRAAAAPMARGTAIGSVLGVVPGGGALLSSFAAYFLEKRISRTPERFGKGAIEGVAAPEAANNAGAQTSFIPMLTLGLPSNAVMAVMIGALTIHGIQPGPRIITQQAEVFWGLIASMWVGNLMLLVVNLPMIGLWVRLLATPYRLLFPCIVAFCCIGVYAVNYLLIELWIAVAFGLIGYLLMKIGFQPAPLVLGLVLGQPLEENFRRALRLSRGDPGIFVESAISLVLLGLAVLMVVLALLPALGRRRSSVFQED